MSLSNSQVGITDGTDTADITAAGALKIDGSAVTQPVSGTVTTTPSGTQSVNIVSTIALPVTDNGGSLTVDGTFFQATQPVSGTITANQGTPAVAANRWPVQITDGTDLALVTTGGALLVDTNTVGTAKTIYMAAAGPITPPATPTDMITITGSATKTIRVLTIEFSAQQTTQSTNTIFIAKRSTANSAGTSTSPTVVPVDSNDAAGTAVVRQYTVNPTLGTLVGNVAIERVFTSVPGATATGAAGYTFDFWNSGASKGIVLRGTTQVLAINFNGAALPIGFSVSATITWVEE